MTREEMQNKIIEIYGFEHPMTIGFFKKCEELEDNSYNNAYLQKIVELHSISPCGQEW